jgi:hypothetical protein
MRSFVTLDSLARTAGVTPAETAGLGLLELSRFVRHGPDGWALVTGAPR